MSTNKLKQLWAAGTPTINGWCTIGDPFVAEIMAAQAYDSITIDVQHGALDYSEALPMFQAMRASGIPLLARAPWRDPASIMKLLDAGATGIICPMINNPEEAAEFASYMRYPPRGQRSFGPTRIGFARPGYGLQLNDEVLAFAMIETADGMANLDAIAATPGIDGLYVGPADLTLGVSNGALPPALDREEPEMIEAIKSIAAACRAHGKIAALHCGSSDYAARGIGWGFHMTTVSSDARLMAASVGDSIAQFHSLTGRDAAKGSTGAY